MNLQVNFIEFTARLFYLTHTVYIINNNTRYEVMSHISTCVAENPEGKLLYIAY